MESLNFYFKRVPNRFKGTFFGKKIAQIAAACKEQSLLIFFFLLLHLFELYGAMRESNPGPSGSEQNDRTD